MLGDKVERAILRATEAWIDSLGDLDQKFLVWVQEVVDEKESPSDNIDDFCIEYLETSTFEDIIETELKDLLDEYIDIEVKFKL